ncbi:MAG: hypothetical protein ACYTG1_09160 [Planctomycetota bacterium]|jgi:hypothetical protein
MGIGTDIAMAGRLATGLGRFLRTPLGPEAARQLVQTQRRRRAESFLRLVERGVFQVPDSPWLALFRHAGLSFDDVRRLVETEGLEPALATLHAAGVRASLDESKGRVPIRRGSLEIPVRDRQFDNPLAARHYEAATGGSRGMRSRMFIDFDLLAHEAGYVQLFLDTFALHDADVGVWWPVPPGSAGLKNLLRQAKLGAPVSRWFSQYPISWRPPQLRPAVLTHLALLVSRVVRRPLPRPEHVPLDEAGRVAAWLAACRRAGRTGILITTVGASMRVCQAARAEGLDISGSFFRVGGEPYTEAKAAVVAEAGCRAASYYAMAETGIIAAPCGRPEAPDDLHILEDKMAVLVLPMTPAAGGPEVAALHHTTLHTSCTRIMINVESGDYATEATRDCGCPLHAAGFHRHLHTIRSYDKLTSEGMTFIGDELLRIVDEVLPRQFGGSPTDYQFVEEEVDGLTRVSLLVSPRVGEIDESAVTDAVTRRLGAERGAAAMMATVWRDGGVLQVQRRDPYATGVAKILPLHVRRNGRG